MTTIERLQQWRDAGLVTTSQYDALRMLVVRERFSVFLELNALLYLGVISLVGGLAWTATTYSERLGDSFVVIVLSGLFASCLFYCFSHSYPFSAIEVESPTLVFDYVLYAGCLILSVELGYIETRFQLLGTAWDHYLLVIAVVFSALAYRFDNRLVLSLGLSSLAGWFGLRFSRFGLLTPDSIRLYALAYGALVAGAGYWFCRLGIKKHFLETYLHVATHVVFVALLTGVEWTAGGWLYLAILLGLCAAAGRLGLKFKRFVFVAYAIAYAYIAISYQVISEIDDLVPSLTYLAITGSLVAMWMVRLAGRLAREE